MIYKGIFEDWKGSLVKTEPIEKLIKKLFSQ